MDMPSVYKQLTGVDIKRQKELWDERGKGYYGEFLVFCELYKNVAGCGKILMNLNVPVMQQKTTEIDLVLIHETGVYVFEIKHYQGTIYGTDTDPTWTQYFRTVKNNCFKNPILQNRYHIDALQKVLPDIPIRSFVVFTNADCDIRVTNKNDSVDVCALYNLSQFLEHRFSKDITCFSMNQIDEIFQKLSVYSQMQEKVVIDAKEESFFSWVQPAILTLTKKKSELEQEKQKLSEEVQKTKKARKMGIVLNVIVAIALACICIFSSLAVIDANTQELNKFKQNFLHIDEIDNPYIDALNLYVDISKVSLSAATNETVSFSARIAMKNTDFGIQLTENSKYIVQTTTGEFREYDVFGEHLKYSSLANIIGKGYRAYGDLAKAYFWGIASTEDISYIKITNIELLKVSPTKTVVKEGLELELYSR